MWLTLREALISGWCSTNLNLICYTFQRAELACTDRIETQMVARNFLRDVKRKRTTHLHGLFKRFVQNVISYFAINIGTVFYKLRVHFQLSL